MATLRRDMEGFLPTVSYPLTAAPFLVAAKRRGIATPALDVSDGRFASGAFYDVVGQLFRSNPEQSMALLLRDYLGPGPDPELRALVQCAPSVGEAFAVMGDVRSLFFDDLRLDVILDGRHAVLRHRGPYAELHHAYNWLFGTWLPTSGEVPADRPVFEEYLNNPRELPPEEWLTEINLPLVAR